ncbi:2Fe-2S iron-sulfur cluster-binding protein [Gordonia terrae]
MATTTYRPPEIEGGMYSQGPDVQSGACRVRVVGVVEETHDARSILVEPHPDHSSAFDYSPGQFLTIRVPDVGSGTARCYSLSSSPHVDPTMKITVKRVDGGHGSNWLCDNVDEGDELEVLPPSGSFKARTLDESVVLVAGGSGITPVMAIAKSILFAGSGHVLLIYANRDEKSVIFGQELRELTGRFADRLTVIHALQSVQGFLTVEALSALIRPLADRAVYTCGPAPLMKVVKEACATAGVESSRVMSERFVSLTSDPFGGVRESVPDHAEDDGSETAADVGAIEVTLDGETLSVPWSGSKRLLDALLDAGVDAPFSCREGACSACVCTLTSGEVRMTRNEVLEDEDVADGYILTCQAEMVSPEISIEY